MKRRILLGGLVAVIAMVVFLVIVLRGGGSDIVPASTRESGDARPQAPARRAGATSSEVVVVGATGKKDESAEQQPEVEEVDTTLPLLKGVVRGEGQRVAGADVSFFATREVETLLLRLEKLIPQGQFPDIPVLVNALRSEIARFRDAAITVKTNGAGEFELRAESKKALPQRDVPSVARVRPGGFLVLTVADGWLFRYGDVVALQKDRTEELTIDLEQGSDISGRVVDDSGLGVGGAELVAEYRPAGAQGVGKLVRRALRMVNGEFLKGPFSTVSAVDGSFTLRSLPPGVYDIAAAKDGVENRLQSVQVGTSGAVVLLGDGAEIRGFLGEGDGVPVGGVTMQLERLDDRVQLPLPMSGFNDIANSVNRFLGEGPREIKSRSDGSFRFHKLGAGGYRLTVEQPGFLRLMRQFKVEWGEKHDAGTLVLDRGNEIRGIVQGPDGMRLPDAAIFAAPANMNMFNMGTSINDMMTGRLRVLCDEEGRFRVGGLGRGQYKLTITHDGYSAVSKSAVKAGTDDLEITLEPGRSVKGRVVAAGSGEGIAMARVTSQGSRTRTDKEGYFALDGVVSRDPDSVNPFGGEGFGPGRRRAREATATATADAEGGKVVKATFRARAKGFVEARVELPFDEIPEEIEFELEPMPEISGVVLDPEGNPAPGSLVRLTPAFPDELSEIGFFDTSLIFLAVTVTDREGKFRLEDFPAEKDSKFQVIADHVKHARGKSESFQIAKVEDDELAVEIRLINGCSVKGRVTDGREPIRGGIVRMRKRNDDEGVKRITRFMSMFGMPKFGNTVHTNTTGEFVFQSVQPGEYVLTAEVAGFEESKEQTVMLAAGDESEVNFVVDPGKEIVGTVADPDGQPISGARVRIIQEGEGDKEFRQAQKWLGGSYKSATTGAEGRYAVGGLPAGTYTIIVSHSGYVRAEVESITPGPAPQNIVLGLAASIRGAVVDAATGEPVKGFRVRLLPDGEELPDWNPRRWGKRFTESGGRYKLGEVEPGKYRVEINVKTYAPSSQEIVVEEGAEYEMDFALSRAGKIRGVVTDLSTGAPISGARILLLNEDGTETPAKKSARKTEESEAEAADIDGKAMQQYFRRRGTQEAGVSAEDGSYVLDSVPGGTNGLLITHSDYADSRRDGVEVALGEELAVDVGLKRGLEIAGQVLEADGEPARGQFIFLRSTSAGTATNVRKGTSVDREGRFRMAGLEPGVYRLLTPKDGKPSRAEPVVINLQSSRKDVVVTLPAR